MPYKAKEKFGSVKQWQRTEGNKKMIINHEDAEYIKTREGIGLHRYNGAYYYSKEICENIIPLVKTNRNWITIKASEKGMDYSICFVHNNVTFEETYKYMQRYKDVIYVVGVPDMVERASKYGQAIYLPLSVDTEYVKQFSKLKYRETACIGRKADIIWRKEFNMPDDIDYIGLLPREELLWEMAKYKRVYAIGRTAIEAKVLGCEILPFHPRFPDVNLWQVLDNTEAAEILQEKVEEIDGTNKQRRCAGLLTMRS